MDNSQIEAAIDLAIKRYAEINKHPVVCPLVPEDVIFVRTWRGRFEKLIMGAGMIVVVGTLSGIGTLIYMGIDAWKGK